MRQIRRAVSLLFQSMCEMHELERLEEEMAGMLAQDQVYWTQNDAKFRAVAQNVSYEQFEEIGKGWNETF